MLALLQNLNVVELVVIGIVAVLVFGPRLPEVARQAAINVAKAKRALQELRRQSGIDDELREARRTIQELEREARVGPAELDAPVRAPLAPRRPPTAVSRGSADALAAEAGGAAPARTRDPALGAPDDAADGGRASAAPSSDIAKPAGEAVVDPAPVDLGGGGEGGDGNDG